MKKSGNTRAGVSSARRAVTVLDVDVDATPDASPSGICEREMATQPVSSSRARTHLSEVTFGSLTGGGGRCGSPKLRPRPVIENAGDTGGNGIGIRNVRKITRRIVYGTASRAIMKRNGRRMSESIDVVGAYYYMNTCSKT